MRDRDYVAYIRTSPASPPLREQREALEAHARNRGCRIVTWIEDPGDTPAGHLRRNTNFLNLCLRLDEDLLLTGVMFWHPGHIANSMDDFVAIMRFIESLNKSWYLESCITWSQDLNERANLFDILNRIRKQILIFDRTEKILTSRKKAANPGKKKISNALERKIVRMRTKGMTIQEIADQLHISKSTVHRVIRDSKIMELLLTDA